MSLDWYDIRISNAISTFDVDTEAGLCVDQPTLDNPFCPLIVRDQRTGAIIDGTSQPVNIGSISTSGAEMTVNYAVPYDLAGRWNLRFVGGYLNKLEYIDTPGADPRDIAGLVYQPRWVASGDLTWNTGPVTLNYGVSWFSKTYLFDRNTREARPDIVANMKAEARWVHDIRASFEVDRRFSLYAGVNNIFDRLPSIGFTAYPVDGVGRYLYAGARVRFGGGS